MWRASFVGIAAVVLLATGGVVLAASDANTSADCNRVYKAKADAGKDISTKQLAGDLNLPIDTVQKCLRRMRHHGPRATPAAAQ